ncbi:hypothetical protein CF319_g8960 [Tilletia indica]|nr:hypothetical protein CF319_g8960 [Tilletia indica]
MPFKLSDMYELIRDQAVKAITQNIIEKLADLLTKKVSQSVTVLEGAFQRAEERSERLNNTLITFIEAQTRSLGREREVPQPEPIKKRARTADPQRTDEQGVLRLLLQGWNQQL